MDENLAETLSKKIRIAKEPIIREEYEMILLQGLFSGKLAQKLIFKGGTALRLAYNSPRFSEDLDFSLTEEIKNEDFAELIEKTVKDLPTAKIKELTEKYYTHFALLHIKEPYLKQVFPIKIEVSKRPVSWKINKDYVSAPVKSQIVPLEVVGFTVTMERVFKDKKRMIKERDKARDLFDLWWLGQKLDKKVSFNLKDAEIKKASRELNQFLPEPMRLVVEDWRKK